MIGSEIKRANFSGTNGSRFLLILTYTLSQSRVENTSFTNYYLYMQSLDNYSGSGATSRGYIKGNEVGTFTSIGKNELKLIGNFIDAVYHDNQGKGTANYIAVIDTSWTLGDAKVEGSFQLPDIPREAKVTGANNFTDIQNPYLTFTNSGGFTVDAYLEFAGTNIFRYGIPNTGNYTFELTESERNLLRSKTPDSSIMNVNYGLRTNISGLYYYSYVVREMSINEDDNSKPTIISPTYTDGNNISKTLVSPSTNLIQGISTLVVNWSKATFKKYATFNRYEIEFAGKTYQVANENTLTLSILNIVQTENLAQDTVYALKLKIFDTRGFSNTMSVNVTVIPYKEPSYNIRIEREGISETTTLYIENGKFSPIIVNGVAKNIVNNMTWKYKKTNDTEYSTTQQATITPTSTYTFNKTQNIGNFAIGDNFDFLVTIPDKLLSVPKTTILYQTMYPFTIAENGTYTDGFHVQGMNPTVDKGFQAYDGYYDKNKRPITSIEYMTLAKTTGQTFGSVGHKKVEFNLLYGKNVYNDSLIFDTANYRVKIGKGVKQVLLSGAGFVQNCASGYLYGSITQNGIWITDAIDDGNAYYKNISFPIKPITVKEGDYIDMEFETLNTPNATTGERQGTYLTVIIVGYE